MAQNNIILEIKNIDKKYPGVVALDNVSIAFKKGEVHALVGENGAGKSTLMKSISGSIAPSNGEILFDNKIFYKMHPKSAIEMGISTIYQEFSLVNHISVAENIFLGNKIFSSVFYNKKQINKKAKELIDSVEVSLDENQLVAKLTPAHQQMVEILRAISRNAKIIIMDEPSAALSNAETKILFKVINKLRRQGITIIYISHRMEEIFEISDRVTVLRDGKYVATLETKATNANELVKLMVGREVQNLKNFKRFDRGDVSIEIKNLSKGSVFNDISFKAYKGEILGFGGLVGAGRTEVMRCIFGADNYTQGEIFLNGKKIKINSPKDAIKNKIALIPEDRKKQGLILGLSIEDNICTAIYKSISCLLFFNKKKKEEYVNKYMLSLNIKAPSSMQIVKNLSGGNQQKVVLAKLLATNSDVVIFDEPTRGIDVGGKYELYEIMKQLTGQGKTVIMVSSDMMELIGISDRIIVMRAGKIMGELKSEEFEQERILALASGILV